MKKISRDLQLTILENLKLRNTENMDVAAIDYYGSVFSYRQLFDKIDVYKRAFLKLCGTSRKPVTIVTPTIPSSIFALYGAIDSNKIANLTSPGFISVYTKKYTVDLDSDTVVILDKFLNDALISRFADAGVRHIIVTSICDYMPADKQHPSMANPISKRNDIEILTVAEFEALGAASDFNTDFPYVPDQIAAYFLTGGTTSRYPKGVKLYSDGINKMAEIYEDLWFDFQPGDRDALFIPLYYATGAIHSLHAGLYSGMTLCPRPIYNRFAFAKDLLETNASLTLAAPSHLATLAYETLPDHALSKIKYIFIGGEAINPAQMEKFRTVAKRLGIKYILNGYGMTETGSMSGVSNKEPSSIRDVSVYPIPQVVYRVVDPVTRLTVEDGKRGVLEVNSPCRTAGYLDESLNSVLFTKDGWVNTGDIAMRDANGGYRVFGRENDYFTIHNQTYAMFDIEEKLLEHPGIAEAEVIKIPCKDGEHPAVFVVPTLNYSERKQEILKYIAQIDLSGMQYLIGTHFLEHFTTNPVTAKRDCLVLQDIHDGYMHYDPVTNQTKETDLSDLMQ